MRFLVGGYTAEQDGSATGIALVHAGAPDAALADGSLAFRGDAVRVEGSPSWVTRHPSLDVVYAAMEGAGAVRAFRRTGEESFAPLGDVVPTGELTCHVAVSPDGATLVASCWGDGRVVRMALDAAGAPSRPTVGAAATDPYAGAGAELEAFAAGALGGLRPFGEQAAGALGGLRLFGELSEADPAEEADVSAGGDADGRPSRAHQAVFLPHGLYATTDMGLDQVRIWRDGRELQRVVLPLGSGPRHMVWHPSGHLYVVTELSLEVFVLASDASGRWRIVGGSPLSSAAVAGVDTAAELACSRDGRFLFAGVRGSDTIAVLRVRGEGDALDQVALVESGVVWPRHHLLARDVLLVAGQHSDDVVSLTVDERTGVPGRVRHRVAVPSPACLLPLR